jgi:tRNA pseudouridine13 synthase
VTTQWMSVQAKDPTVDARARDLAIEGITVHEVRRHGNKLKTGHLAGNRFEIVVRGMAGEDVQGACAALERIGREGLPNAFGPQRFGAQGDNAERAKKWIMGDAPAPRDARLRRMHWSALQSAVFNAVLETRIAEGSWNVPLEGDILKVASGGIFVCTDVQTDRERALRREVWPTGPIVGVKMREPSGRPLEIERAAAARILGETFDLARTRALGEGSRRAMVTDVKNLRAVEQADGVRVYFVLPKGAYATTVLGGAIRLESPVDGAPAEGAGTDES